jgi:hypothetical protein
MAEEPIFIRMNISYYGAMLKLKMDEEDRATVTRLQAEAEQKLATCPPCRLGDGEGDGREPPSTSGMPLPLWVWRASHRPCRHDPLSLCDGLSSLHQRPDHRWSFI